jgi:hypothetical protein
LQVLFFFSCLFYLNFVMYFNTVAKSLAKARGEA